MKRAVAVVLVLTLVLGGLTACGTHDDDSGADEATSGQETASSTESTMTEDSSNVDVPGVSPGVVDQDAIRRELEAIQRELDGAALPDDSDFSDLEDGL